MSEHDGLRTARLAPWYLTLSLLLPGCTNVIAPPERPARPISVFLLDHGRHATLVLPADDSLLVRYAYGDWRYYARRETGALEASAAVLLPTRAALGRRELKGEATDVGVRRAVEPGIEAVHTIIVDAGIARRLRRRLDYLFEEAEETRTYNRAYDLEFVHHPRDYTIFYNSNRMVVEWLRSLGCRVSGLLLFSRWRVEIRNGAEASEDAPDTY